MTEPDALLHSPIGGFSKLYVTGALRTPAVYGGTNSRFTTWQESLWVQQQRPQ